MNHSSVFLYNPTCLPSDIEKGLLKSHQIISPYISNLMNLNYTISDCLQGLLFELLKDFQPSLWLSLLHFHNKQSCLPELLQICDIVHRLDTTSIVNLLKIILELAKSDMKIDKLVAILLRYSYCIDLVEFLPNCLAFLKAKPIFASSVLTLQSIVQTASIDRTVANTLNLFIRSAFENHLYLYDYFNREQFSLKFNCEVVRPSDMKRQFKCSELPIYLSQLPYGFEDKLWFLFTKVYYSDRKFHVKWLCEAFIKFNTWQLKFAIRYICTSIHPTNEILASPVIHRWVFFLELYQRLTTELQKTTMLEALVYDIFYYSSGEIMNVEPLAFILFPGDAKFASIANETWKVLKSSLECMKYNQNECVANMKRAFQDIMKLSVISKSRSNRAFNAISSIYKDYYDRVLSDKLNFMVIDLQNDDLYDLSMESDKSHSSQFIISSFQKIIADTKSSQDSKEVHIYELFEKSFSINEQQVHSCYKELSEGLLKFHKLPINLYKKLLLLEKTNLNHLIVFSHLNPGYSRYRLDNLSIRSYLESTNDLLVKQTLITVFKDKNYSQFNQYLFKLITASHTKSFAILIEFINPKLNCLLKDYIYLSSEPILIKPTIDFSFLQVDDAAKYLCCDLLFFEAKLHKLYFFFISCLNHWSTINGTFNSCRFSI